MEKICQLTFLAIALTLLSTCDSLFAQAGPDRAAGKHPIENVRWLLGSWETATKKGTVLETWEKLNDKEFAGKSYAVKGSDTLVFERVRLVETEGTLFYIPTVHDQNDGKPVSFRSRSVSPAEMIFENPAHDFPQQITYRQISGDSLQAVVSGTVKGKLKSQTYNMRRLRH
jgi:hypothetical protein